MLQPVCEECTGTNAVIDRTVLHEDISRCTEN
jgi:hypothetical protein